MQQDFQQDITITSKGQLTLPVKIRKALKLGTKRKVRIAVSKEGTVTLRPLPDVMSFFGVLKSRIPYNADEKVTARRAQGRRASRVS